MWVAHGTSQAYCQCSGHSPPSGVVSLLCFPGVVPRPGSRTNWPELIRICAPATTSPTFCVYQQHVSGCLGTGHCSLFWWLALATHSVISQYSGLDAQRDGAALTGVTRLSDVGV